MEVTRDDLAEVEAELRVLLDGARLEVYHNNPTSPRSHVDVGIAEATLRDLDHPKVRVMLHYAHMRKQRNKRGR